MVLIVNTTKLKFALQLHWQDPGEGNKTETGCASKQDLPTAHRTQTADRNGGESAEDS